MAVLRYDNESKLFTAQMQMLCERLDANTMERIADEFARMFIKRNYDTLVGQIDPRIMGEFVNNEIRKATWPTIVR